MDNVTPPPIQSGPVPPVQTEPHHKPNWLRWLFIIVGIATLSSIATLIVANAQFRKQQPIGTVACREDAKLCPDGSYVGRKGPKCEFTPCPNNPTPTPDETVGWKKVSLNNLQFRIPNTWWDNTFETNQPTGSFVAINPEPLPVPSDALPAYTLIFEKSVTLDQKQKQIESGYLNVKKTIVTISNQQVILFEATQPAGIRDEVRLKFALLSDSLGTYTFADENNLTDHEIYFGKILSTFRFTNQTTYTCPAGKYVNCMPIVLPEKKYMCEKDYLDWATANCPNFKGATY